MIGFEDIANRQNGLVDFALKSNGMSEKQFLEAELKKWKASKERKSMLDGYNYYTNKHDILNKKRQAIGKDGRLIELLNLPNAQIIDNQYAKIVDQKVNYILGNPIKIDTEDETYKELLGKYFNKNFSMTLNNLAEDALNYGLGWLHVFIDKDGHIGFKRVPAYEIMAYWSDYDHTVLDMAVRIYKQYGYEGSSEVSVEKVEVYKKTGIEYYILKNGSLVVDVEREPTSYIVMTNEHGEHLEFNFQKIPLVAFKYNNHELPLIVRVKCLQDAINEILSNFQNNMQEDARNTILVIENFDGTDLGEFRQNLTTYGAVKVRTSEGGGGVSTLHIDVNSENYKTILDLLKKALIENARGYDAKDDRLSGNANQLNIKSMYSDIDLDANGMITEFQSSFEQLLWFINSHEHNVSVVNNTNIKTSDVEFVFNKNMLINESELIANCAQSVGLVSNETILQHHPFVTDVSKEMERISQENTGEVVNNDKSN